MATYREAAATELSGALAAHSWDQMAAKASIATTYAVLALLGYIQQDDANADAQTKLERIEAEVLSLHNHNRWLTEELKGTRAALRARDDALNTEMKERGAEPHEHGWIDITAIHDLPSRMYVCHACDATKLVGPDGNEIDSAQ